MGVPLSAAARDAFVYIHRQWDMTVHSSEMEGEPEPAPPEVTHAVEAMSEGNELQGQE